MKHESIELDRRIAMLVRQAIVPVGFRPQSDREIEDMLEGLGPEEISDIKLQRMLDKIHGPGYLKSEFDEGSQVTKQAETSEFRELAEMFRAQGDELPPELEEQIREMERRAAEPPSDDDDDK